MDNMDRLNNLTKLYKFETRVSASNYLDNSITHFSLRVALYKSLNKNNKIRRNTNLSGLVSVITPLTG